MKIAAALIALLLTACATGRPGASAPLGPIVTDRPDFTESAEVVAPRHAQLEGGYTVNGEGPDHEHALGELLLRVGVAPRAELRLTSGFVVATAAGDVARGLQDASVGAKLGFLAAPRGALPALSIIAATTVPSGHRAFRDDRATPEAKLLLAWALPRETAFAMNLNASRPTDERGRFGAYAWSATAGHAVGERTGAYAELFAVADARGARETRWANAGLTWLVHDALQLDVRAGTRLGGVAWHSFFMGVGASRRW
jgi:Putative MetA-pathway of phenol degradation